MKHAALLMMFLVGLLIPMTLASKTLDFNVNSVLFDDVTIVLTTEVKSMQIIKMKSTDYGEEVAVQNVRCSEYVASIAVAEISTAYLVESFPKTEGLIVLLLNGDNLIRYL